MLYEGMGLLDDCRDAVRVVSKAITKEWRFATKCGMTVTCAKGTKKRAKESVSQADPGQGCKISISPCEDNAYSLGLSVFFSAFPRLKEPLPGGIALKKAVKDEYHMDSECFVFCGLAAAERNIRFYGEKVRRLRNELSNTGISVISVVVLYVGKMNNGAGSRGNVRERLKKASRSFDLSSVDFGTNSQIIAVINTMIGTDEMLENTGLVTGKTRRDFPVASVLPDNHHKWRGGWT